MSSERVMRNRVDGCLKSIRAARAALDELERTLTTGDVDEATRARSSRLKTQLCSSASIAGFTAARIISDMADARANGRPVPSKRWAVMLGPGGAFVRPWPIGRMR